MGTHPRPAEYLETLAQLRTEFSGWAFQYRDRVDVPWVAQRQPGVVWRGGITALEADTPQFLRELLNDVAVLDGRRKRRS